MRKYLSLLFLIAISLTQGTIAQIPRTLSYQGVLTDTSGAVVPDGSYNFTFKLYDVATGGTEIWMEMQNGVIVVNGIFNVILGSVNPLNLPFDEKYWLGMTVGSATELSPRIELTSAAYSLNASSGGGGNTLDQAYDQGGSGMGRTITADAGAVNIGGPDGLGVTGNVGIGTTNPAAKTHIKGGGTGTSQALLVTNSANQVNVTLFDNGNLGLGDQGPDATLEIVKRGTTDLLNLSSSTSADGDLLTVTNNGNVGIGTFNPNQELTVNGNVEVSGDILLEGNIVTSSNISIRSDSGNVIILAGASRITVDPWGGVTIESDSIKLNSTGKLKLSGKTVEILSQQNMEIRAGTSLDVEGTPVNVLSSASMNLTGTQIKLNGPGLPAARQTDPVIVDPLSGIGQIASGSSSVFIGQ